LVSDLWRHLPSSTEKKDNL